MAEVLLGLVSSEGAENEWPHPAYLHVVTSVIVKDSSVE